MDKKEAYWQKLEAELREWGFRIDEFKARAEKAEDNLKTSYRVHLDTLRAKRETARQKLHELKEESGGAWEDLKEGVEKAWSELRHAVEEATTKFKS